jgi:hypothetical protein
MGAREAAVKRGWAIRRADFWNPESAADVVVLDAGDRHRRRIKLTGKRGTEFRSISTRRWRCATVTASCSTTAASCW